MTTVNRYRLFCQTESTYVYTWATSIPSTCPNNNQHTIDSNSIVQVDSVSENLNTISNLPLTSFNELRVAERTKVVELKSIFGKSNLRDIYIETGTGTITNNLGDDTYALQVSDADDVARLQSAERGRYVAGLQGEVGIAARLPSSLTGNQSIKIGLFDDSNGLYFKYTSSGLNVSILRDGVETNIPRDDWNVDKMDGTGPSGINLTITNGLIWKIIFSWYGFGAINYYINTTHPITKVHNNYLVHVHDPATNTSIKNPNLPLSVELANNGTVATTTCNVSGRQYSLLGKYDAITRINSHYRVGRAVNSTVNFLPIISIRRKQGYLGNPVSALETDFGTNQDLFVQIRVNNTLTGASFGNVTDTSPNDTAVEVDTTATALTGGIPIWTGLVSGTSRFGSLNINYDLSEYQILTLCARGVTSQNGTANCVLRWTEEW